MSKYENYDLTSANYDKTRSAVGIEIVIGYIASINKDSESLNILDAGCGTGNYSLELKKYFPNIWCADFSIGMLRKCKQKFEHNKMQANLLRCDISELPFRENVLDVIMCNQSLHHIDDPKDKFTNLSKFLKKASSSLKEDGILLINTITHQQLKDGVWWGDLIKPAIERSKKRFTTDEQLIQLLDEAGLKINNRVVMLDTIIQNKNYFDSNSLFDKEFRDGDSHFSLLSPEELETTLDAVKEIQISGEMTKYINERDELRKKIGQFTYYIIEKK